MMIEALRMDCPNGHTIAAVFFDSQHVNYSIMYAMAPDALGWARVANRCRHCGESCPEPRHRISKFENFAVFKTSCVGHITLPKDLDVKTLSVLIVSEQEDGEATFFSMNLLAKLPTGKPSRN